tara:strand:- start:2170 stop:2892 length:723 start_codon:yes stop_codon:yes gene_type:complete
METVFGKGYDYAKYLPDLDDLRIDSDGNFDQIFTNLRGLSKYVDVSLEGPPLGINYFLYTGKCTGGKDDGKSKYTYIRNVPMGNTFMGGKYKGIVPGIMEDMSDLNPIQLIKPLFESVPEKSLSDRDKQTNSNCKQIKRLDKLCKYKGGCKTKCKTKRVDKNYDECKDLEKEPKKWSKKYSVFCSKKDKAKVAKLCESFTNFTPKTITEHYKNIDETNYLTKLIITLIVLLFIYFIVCRC